MHLANPDVRPVVRRIPETIEAPHPSIRPRHQWYLPFKFIGEWIAALVLLVPAMLVIGFTGLLVKITSRGKVFYRQRRMGMNGKIFTMVKIRTMVEDSEVGTGPVWSQPGDPRVTKIGRILRDTHL